MIAVRYFTSCPGVHSLLGNPVWRSGVWRGGAEFLRGGANRRGRVREGELDTTYDCLRDQGWDGVTGGL